MQNISKYFWKTFTRNSRPVVSMTDVCKMDILQTFQSERFKKNSFRTLQLDTLVLTL